MAKYITEAIDSINSSFSGEWEDNYSFNSSIPDVLTNKVQYDLWHQEFKVHSENFRKLLNDLKETIFEKLNASVLAGEYVEVDDFDKQLKALSEAIKIPISGTSEPIVQTLLSEELKSNFIDVVEVAIQSYLNLVNKVRKRHQNDEKSTITLVDYDKEKLKKGGSKYLSFFKRNLKLGELDHFLTPDIQQLRELNDLENKIANSGVNKLSVLLQHKCKFLICKWILTQEELTKESVYAFSGGDIIHLNIDSLKCQFLPKWKDYMESHYEIDSRNYKSKIKATYEAIKNKTVLPQEILDLHCKIKYFKDVKPNYKNLQKVRKDLKDIHDSIQNSGTFNDKYAISISYLYALNNELSYLIQNKPTEEKEISDLYEEIISFQNTTGLKNFFPQHKYLGFLVKKLEKIFESRKALDGVESSRKIVEKCESVFKTYKEHIDWSEKNYNYIFLLPFNESFIEVENEIIEKVYIASTFILPLSKTKNKNEFEENRRSFYKYKSSIEVFENLEKDVRDNQNRELRSMEIIGIFTAIVTFMATSIPTFQFVKSAYQAAIFMFALACSMGVFVLMIIICTRGIHKLKQHIGIIITILLIAIAAWLSLIYGTTDPADEKNDIKLAKERIDVINKYLLKMNDLNNKPKSVIKKEVIKSEQELRLESAKKNIKNKIFKSGD